MFRSKSLSAVLSLPMAFALGFGSLASSAFADAEAQRLALDAKLREFAYQENKLLPTSTAAQIAAVNTTTAVADDLVYAVYELVKQAAGDETKISDIAAGALLAVPGATATAAPKVRADKDKVVGRIMEATVVGSIGVNNALPANARAIVSAVIAKLGAVNNTLAATKQLTLAGKELLIAKALRTGVAQGTTAITDKDIATDIAAKVGDATFFTPAGATDTAKDTARTAFNVAVLKLLAFKPITNDPAVKSTAGTYFPIRSGNQLTVQGEPAFVEGVPPSIFNVSNYIDRALENYIVTPHATAALNMAAGVAATVPSAAGAVIAGYVQEFRGTAASVAAADQVTLDYLKGTSAATSIVANAKLAAAVSDIVADSLRQISTSQFKVTSAVTLATGQTVALKGKIASGGIRADPSDATTIVNQILAVDAGVAGKGVLQTGIAAFAGAAAVGNSSAADEITLAAIGKLDYKQAAGNPPTTAAQTAATKADNTKIQAVAIAVGKSVALVDPDSANAVAQSLFTVMRNGSNPYSTPGVAGEPARIQLAVDLSKGLATNYSAAGAAVAGVVQKTLTFSVTQNTPTTDESLDRVAGISAAAIKASPKAAVMIALKVSNSTPLRLGLYVNGGTSQGFAAKLASNLQVATTSAGAIAAGVALSDTANSGVITAAVINARNGTLQASALTIANTVAINVDVEAIGKIAQSVGALLANAKGPGNTTQTSKLPKITTGLTTLATSLAKAINLKPLVVWANRVDEISELAAELTNQYLARAGVADSGVPNTSSAADVKILATALSSIGTSIFKAASAKLLANTGNMSTDVKDLAFDVAGAIAQVIAKNTTLSMTTRDALLAETYTSTTNAGLLYKNLITAATASKSTGLVKQAFDEILLTRTANSYGIVAGTKTTATGTGKFETGVVYEVGTTDPETPIKNL